MKANMAFAFIESLDGLMPQLHSSIMDTRNDLNLTLFAKIVALARSKTHDGHDTSHERSAAWAKAESMAEASGLSLSDALKRLDATTGPSPGDTVSPREWAEFLRRAAEAEARKRAARPEFIEHDLERALREAMEARGWCLSNLIVESMPRHVRKVIRDAIPWPATLREIIAEVKIWDSIEDGWLRHQSGYVLSEAPRLRRLLLVETLSVQPAKSVADAMARVAWLIEQSSIDTPASRRLDRNGPLSPIYEDMRTMETMIRSLKQGVPAKVTAKARRAAILAILSEPGGMALPLRVVARREGCAPQKVANVKAQTDPSNLDKLS